MLVRFQLGAHLVKKIELLLFDLDGTLIDSKKDIASSVHHTMRVLGLPPIENEIIYSFVGNGVTPLIKKSVEAGGGVGFEAALSIFKEYYDRHCLDTTRPFPGILQTLKHFLKTPVVVVTNKSQGFSEKILKGLKMDPYLQGIYGGDTSFPKKPDPAIVHHLMKEFSASPANTAIVGDSLIDMKTGKNAGILTCGVTWGFRPKEELEAFGPDELIDSPKDLMRIFTTKP